MLLKSLLTGIFVVSGTAAIAGDAAPGTKVSLDVLRTKCADIVANPQMVKPTIKITCNELSYHWTAGPTKNANLPNQRKVGAEVQMKGLTVGQSLYDSPVEPLTVQCATFYKVERQVQNVDIEQSCEQLASIKDLGQFCAPILDQRVAQDPGLATEKTMEDVISLCPQQ